jgi:hypothetical protein
MTVSLLADNLENRLNKSVAILEITSKLPEVKNLTYASSLNQTLRTLHGIGKDLDIPKRKVAQNILSADKDFETIFFLMPNGNIYMQEPYSRQLNLTKTNFDFRDYYKGAVSTHTTYLGNVIILLLQVFHKPILQFQFTLKIIIIITVDNLFWASGLVV